MCGREGVKVLYELYGSCNGYAIAASADTVYWCLSRHGYGWSKRLERR